MPLPKWITDHMLPMAAADDKPALRKFAWQMSIAFPLFFALLLPWIFSHPMPMWPFYVAAILLVSAYLVPVLLFPLYVVWTVFASLLGWLNTFVILALAFYLLIFPIGLVLRLLGKLGYQTKLKLGAKSYWIQRVSPPQKDNLKEPF